MKTYSFTIRLLEVDETRTMDDITDVLFEAGCDDATFSMSNNIALLDFDREGESREEAIISAIKNITDAKICGSCEIYND